MGEPSTVVCAASKSARPSRCTVGTRPAPAAASDSAAVGYLRGAFALADRDGRPISLGWQGTRRAADLAWITLRGATPRGLSGLQLQNRILFDSYADQIDIVQAPYDGSRTSLLFTNGEGVERLSWPLVES
jgi:hypothetical protein